jgi:hypothetical protein
MPISQIMCAQHTLYGVRTSTWYNSPGRISVTVIGNVTTWFCPIGDRDRHHHNGTNEMMLQCYDSYEAVRIHLFVICFAKGNATHNLLHFLDTIHYFCNGTRIVSDLPVVNGPIVCTIYAKSA